VGAALGRTTGSSGRSGVSAGQLGSVCFALTPRPLRLNVNTKCCPERDLGLLIPTNIPRAGIALLGSKTEATSGETVRYYKV
jgi:hypothetical protein